ncbi:MAG: hypothetical protein V2B16_01325 [bacterium]
MAEIVKNELKYDHFYDQKNKQHYLNGTLIVLHCHHYTALYTQLALDANETELLKETARDSFRKMLNTYLKKYYTGNSIREIMELCCQYHSILGLGQMKVIFLGEDSGEVEMVASHVDEGWKKKFGIYDRPINYISAGFIEAMFEVVLGTNPKEFSAIETQSIVMGATTSKFNVIRR